MFVDDEASHENNTGAQQGIELLGESVLVDREHVVTHLTEQLIGQEHKGESLGESIFQERRKGKLNDF